MPSEHPILLTDLELAPIQNYANCHGLTVEEATSQLFHEAMAKRYRSGFHRPPAKVYDIKPRTLQ